LCGFVHYSAYNGFIFAIERVAALRNSVSRSVGRSVSMPVAETWLLPDGVTDVLPERAGRLEQLRRQLLDTLAGRGYELIYTPLVEYVESLLITDNST
jgi:hypothetical protein